MRPARSLRRGPVLLAVFAICLLGCAGSGGKEPAIEPGAAGVSGDAAPGPAANAAPDSLRVPAVDEETQAELEQLPWFSDTPGSAPGDTLASADNPAAADTLAVPDSLAVLPDPLRGSLPDTTGEAAGNFQINPATGLIVDEEGDWVLDGEDLSSASTDSGQVISIRSPVITHGDLRVTARRGIYEVNGEVARLYDDVTFTDPGFRGKSETAYYYRDREMLHALGNVEVEQDSLRVRGDEGFYYQGRDSFLIRDHVMGWKGTRFMEAREAEWFREENEVHLWGDVVVVDTEEETRLSGNRITYDLDRDLAYVTESPGLKLNPGQEEETDIRAENLWVDPDGSTRARGNVIIFRGAVTATSDSAAFFRDRQLAILLGNPEVEERDGTLTGDTLYLHFDEDETIDLVQVHGNAGIRFVPKDSLRLGERSTVRGDSLTMFFEGDEADRVLVFGSATSTYRPADGDVGKGAGTNAVRGDSITVYLDQGKVSRVRVNGNAKGVYSFVEGGSGEPPPGAAADTGGAAGVPAPGDTVAAGAAADTVGVGPLETFGPDAAERIDETVPGKERVIYSADEVLYTLDEKTVDLAGNTVLDYGALNLTAGKVRFYAERRYLDAEENPVLTDSGGGEQKEVVGARMDYNLDTREGTIQGGRTKAEDGFIYAEKLRQIGDQQFIARDGNFTTCDHAADGGDPHYHFTSKKMRVYLKDKVVAKPVTLYIRDIPILALPFYVFSIKKGRHSGFLTPNFDFGIAGSTGRFFQNLGYYWAASEYWDVGVSTQYTENTSRFVANLDFKYAKRYLMNGSSRIRRSFGGENSGEYDIEADHRMTLGAWSVTGKAAFRNRNFRLQDPLGDNIEQRVDRLLQSDISASRNFGFGASLYLTFDREEDIATVLDDGDDETVLTETLPQYRFSLNQRTLGRRPDENGEGGKLAWLANTRLGFSSSGSTTRSKKELTTITETVIAPDSTVADTTFGYVRDRSSRAVHTATVSNTEKVLGAFNVSPSFRVNENWVDREFSAADTVKGFRRAATWSASAGINTKLYGTFPGLGPVQAIRHTFYPQASFSYQPEFSSLTYEDTSGVRRNRYPGVSAGRSKLLNLSVENNFQAKVGGETPKKVDLFRWTLASSYNLLLAERGERGWGNVSSAVNFSQLSRIGLTFTSTHDPYSRFRMDYFNVTGSYGLSGILPGGEEGAPAPGQTTSIQGEEDGGRAPGAAAGGLNWNAGFRFSWGGSRNEAGLLKPRAQVDTDLSLQITENWSVSYQNHWDSVEGKVISDYLSLTRNLHCWEAQFTRSRYAGDTSFYFRINVKQLSDVKYEQGQRGGSGLTSLTGFLP